MGTQDLWGQCGSGSSAYQDLADNHVQVRIQETTELMLSSSGQHSFDTNTGAFGKLPDCGVKS